MTAHVLQYWSKDTRVCDFTSVMCLIMKVNLKTNKRWLVDLWPLKGLMPRVILCIMASLTSLLRTHWMPKFWKLEKTSQRCVRRFSCPDLFSSCILLVEHWSQRLTGRLRLELTILTYCLKLRARWSSKALFCIQGNPLMASYSETTCFLKKKKNGQRFGRELWCVCGLE